jgi:hypothetical protein
MPEGARKEALLSPGHGMVEGAAEHARKPQDADREMTARLALILPIIEQNREKIQLYWPLRDVQTAPPHPKG